MRCRILILVGALTFGAQAASANDSCNPDFGDKALDWVRNHAGPQSRYLTKTDYDGRALNLRIVGFERLHEKLNAAAKELDGISAEVDELDRSPRSEIALAVQREIVARRNLTRLYNASASLEEADLHLATLINPATREAFLAEGYRAVGRESLVASIREVGAAAEATLSGRYGFYIEVTFNENGAPTGGTAKPSTPGGNFIGVGLSLISTMEPYAVVGGAILVIIGGAIDTACMENWRTQERHLREASALLPQHLITDDEQWSLFQHAEQAAVKRFAEHGAEVRSLTAAVRARWVNLFAANATRAAAADSVLTAARVARIQRDMRNGLDPAAILEQVAVSTVASDIGRVNAAIARGRIKVVTACLNAPGLAVEEDQIDAVAFARAQLEVLRRQASFAPLYDLVERSLVSISTAEQELRRRGPTGAGRGCDPAHAPRAMLDDVLLDLADLQTFIPVAQPFRSIDSSPIARLTRHRPARTAANSGWNSLCTMLSRGQPYPCSRGGHGPTYGGQFGSRSGDPGRDIRQGAGDGGFAEDSRRLSHDIDAARSNIDQRIADVQRRTQAAEEALPEWRQTNGAAVVAATAATADQTLGEATRSFAFQENEAPVLARVRRELDRFTASPTDPNNVRDLVGAAGAEDLRLPDVSADSLVTTIPEVTGFQAIRTKFGSGVSAGALTAIRERLKATRDLVSHPSHTALSSDLTHYSERLAREGTLGGRVLADQLILDSASLRFAAAGRIPHPEFAFVERDGSISRRPVSNLEDLPSNALINVNRRFYRDDTYFRTSAAQLRSELNAGAPFAGRRSEIADTADQLAIRARGAFRAGDMLAAESYMAMAIGVLDVATRFIPGVSWGRDVYEAVSGRDLFTGEELTTFDRVTAVIGVLTAGLGDDGLKIYQVLKRIDGIPTRSVDRLYEFGKTVDADTLTELRYSEHALERINQRYVDESDIRAVLDNHRPFVYTPAGTYNAIGESRGRNLVVGIDVEDQKLTTVFWEDDLPRLLSERIGSGPRSGDLRYKPLDLID